MGCGEEGVDGGFSLAVTRACGVVTVGQAVLGWGGICMAMGFGAGRRRG